MTDNPTKPDVSLRKIGNVSVEMMKFPAAADGSGQVPLCKVAPTGLMLPKVEPASNLPSIAKAR